MSDRALYLCWFTALLVLSVVEPTGFAILALAATVTVALATPLLLVLWRRRR